MTAIIKPGGFNRSFFRPVSSKGGEQVKFIETLYNQFLTTGTSILEQEEIFSFYVLRHYINKDLKSKMTVIISNGEPIAVSFDRI